MFSFLSVNVLQNQPTDKVTSNTSIKPKFQQDFSSIFEWMPTCSVFIDGDANILEANEKALLFFKFPTKNTFLEFCSTTSIFIDIPIILETIKEISITKRNVKKKTLLRKFDRTIACIDIEIASLPNKSDFFLIQFLDNSHESHSIFIDLVHCFKNDIAQLKPYLNKPGKELLEQIINNKNLEGIINNTPLRNQQMDLIQQERILKFSEMFPKLTNGELQLCAYLSLKISNEEIAKITGKTSNSIRVAFHRIVGKTDYSNGKDLLMMIQSLK